METPTSDIPHLQDLGYFTKEMSETMLTWVMQLQRLGKQLIEDKELPDVRSESYETCRRLIQNNMDAARYLGPQFQNYSGFICHLASSRPRKLSVIPASRHQLRQPPRSTLESGNN